MTKKNTKNLEVFIKNDVVNNVQKAYCLLFLVINFDLIKLNLCNKLFSSGTLCLHFRKLLHGTKL